MDLCIKTEKGFELLFLSICFNPCFNGSMYKNCSEGAGTTHCRTVSILVLMDLCIKTIGNFFLKLKKVYVSILVLMDLCIKTKCIRLYFMIILHVSILVLMDLCIKTRLTLYEPFSFFAVSILVLMDLCIKTHILLGAITFIKRFQSLF